MIRQRPLPKEATSVTRVLVNGVDQGAVDPADRGLTLGDGVFETVAIRDGHVLRWRTHLQRLARGCKCLGLPAPDDEALTAEASAVVPAGATGVLRITWSRGPGGHGYAPPAQQNPTRILQFRELDTVATVSAPITVRTCALRLGVQPALAGIKHTSRVEQVLARAEWSDPGIAEGLLYDRDDRLVEATASNVFLVQDGELRTPRLDACGVAGVMRSSVLAAAQRMQIGVRIERLYADDIAAADEIFLTNCVAGIRPVGQVDDRGLAPGRITAQLGRAATGVDDADYRSE